MQPVNRRRVENKVVMWCIFFQMDKLAIGAQLFTNKEKREKQKNRQIDNQIKIKSRTYSNREIRAEKNI